MSEPDFSNSFSEALSFAPARRDTLMEGGDNAVSSIFYSSAIMARSWIEPNSGLVKKVFKTMIEDTSAGKTSVYRAVLNAKSQLQDLFR